MTPQPTPTPEPESVPDSAAGTADASQQFDLVFRGKNIMTTAGVAARDIGVLDGVITAIEPLGNNLSGRRVIELDDDETLLPGLVDTHVHVNEPGRTEWEGFASATRAAAPPRPGVRPRSSTPRAAP